MVSFKTHLAFFVVAIAACVATNGPVVPLGETVKYHEPEPIIHSSTTPIITSSTSNTSTPTTSTPTTSTPTTSAPTTSAPTTSAPNITTSAPTTSAPTTSAPTTSAPTTTTSAPSTSTHTPNITTPSPFIPTTTETPNSAKTWDGSSFLGGMILAFGLVAVGFVGYRFFYLGRGGAYHTL